MVYLITCLTDSKKGDVHVSPREKRKKNALLCCKWTTLVISGARKLQQHLYM